MSAAFQAIINGVHAAARCTGWGFPQRELRPRDRRQALAVRQDA